MVGIGVASSLSMVSQTSPLAIQATGTLPGVGSIVVPAAAVSVPDAMA